MDAIVSQVGKKNNCTFCGVFRRQALDRGAAALNVDHIVTGHNADDIAETVLMNSTSNSFLLDHTIHYVCSHAWGYCPSRSVHPDLHAGRRHDQTVKAVQVRL